MVVLGMRPGGDGVARAPAAGTGHPHERNCPPYDTSSTPRQIRPERYYLDSIGWATSAALDYDVNGALEKVACDKRHSAYRRALAMQALGRYVPIRDVVRRVLRGALEAALFNWRLATEETSRQKGKAATGNRKADSNAKAYSHYMRNRGVGALRHWRRAAHTNTPALPRHRRFVKASAFYAWYDVKEASRSIGVAKRLFRLRLKSRAWRSWALSRGVLSTKRRSLEAWLEVTQLQNAKRRGFAERQMAINRALLHGDALLRKRRRELVTASFAAWRLQIGLMARMRRLLTRRSRGAQRQAWGAWASLVIGTEVLRRKEQAYMVARMHCLLRGLRRWRELVKFSVERREMLRTALFVILQADEVGAMEEAFGRWTGAVSAAEKAAEKAEAMRGAGILRHKQSFLRLWADFCSAMRRGSPLPAANGARALKAIRHLAGTISPSERSPRNRSPSGSAASGSPKTHQATDGSRSGTRLVETAADRVCRDEASTDDEEDTIGGQGNESPGLSSESSKISSCGSSPVVGFRYEDWYDSDGHS